MDEETRKFLIANSWEDLQDVFDREEITAEVLLSIKEKDLGIFLPNTSFGFKRKIILARDRWSAQRGLSVPNPNEPTTSTVEMPPTTSDNEVLPFDQTVSDDRDDTDSAPPASTLNIESMEMVLDEDLNVDDDNDDDEFSISLQHPQRPPPSASHLKLSTEISEILEKSTPGKILKEFTNRRLVKSEREKLAELIINHELRNDLNTKISTPRFINLSIGIQTLFPYESSRTYYIPYLRLSSGRKCGAKGKLLNRYHNHRRTLLDKKLVWKYTKTYTVHEAATTDHPEVEPTALDDLEWLKSGIEPAHLVNEKWLNTVEIRLKEIAEDLPKYLETYPALRVPSLKDLFLIDFNFKFPGKGDAFFNSWPTVEKAVYAYAKKLIINDRKLRAALQREGIPICDVSEDPSFQTLNALFLLSRLLPISRNIRGQKKGKLWHPSRAEGQSGFLLFADAARIDEALTLRRTKYETFGISMQPTVAICGSDKKRISSSFVYLNGIKYLTDTPLQAVDLCVKICFVLNLKFPAEANYVYNFLQNFCYKIPNNETIYPPVISLGEDLGLTLATEQ